MRFPCTLLLSVALTMAGCGDGTTEPTVLSRIVVGNIDAVGDERVLEAPGTAIAGELVNVTVTTFGNSCVGAAGAAVVVQRYGSDRHALRPGTTGGRLPGFSKCQSAAGGDRFR